MRDIVKRQMLDAIDKEISSVNKVLNKLESYKIDVDSSFGLKAKKRGNKFEYYIGPRGSLKGYHYARAGDLEFVKLIAQRDYNEHLASACKAQILLLSRIRKGMEKSRDLGSVYGSLSQGRRRLVNPIVYSYEEYGKMWVQNGQSLTSYMPETLAFVSKSGVKMRSKSEVLIADILDEFGIFYVYEKPLVFENNYSKVIPDFTILDPATFAEVYLEHFGLMTDSDYARKTVQKINQYQSNGFVLGDKLLITMEGENISLNLENVRSMIRNRFT